uniref:BAR domain-containing protein n=1 Tax=Athene cunicularia TaxID=194338 RepID=A0A663MJT9_ATHCN
MHKDLPSRGGWLEVPPSADSSFFFLHRAQEATELLPEDLMQIEQRIEPAKRAAHNVSKRLQACLQGQCGSEMDKRVKKLPLMVLSMTMAESFKELDTESSLGKALEMGCCIQSSLAKILAEFEIALEHDVLQPLNRLSELQHWCWHWPGSIFCCQQTGDLKGRGGGSEEEGGAVQGENVTLPHWAALGLETCSPPVALSKVTSC